MNPNPAIATFIMLSAPLTYNFKLIKIRIRIRIKIRKNGDFS